MILLHKFSQLSIKFDLEIAILGLYKNIEF